QVRKCIACRVRIGDLPADVGAAGEVAAVACNAYHGNAAAGEDPGRLQAHYGVQADDDSARQLTFVRASQGLITLPRRRFALRRLCRAALPCGSPGRYSPVGSSSSSIAACVSTSSKM
ncbi:hypothetical protein LCGC14_2979930, partial [marine sediment metagenome]